MFKDKSFLGCQLFYSCDRNTVEPRLPVSLGLDEIVWIIQGLHNGEYEY